MQVSPCPLFCRSRQNVVVEDTVIGVIVTKTATITIRETGENSEGTQSENHRCEKHRFPLVFHGTISAKSPNSTDVSNSMGRAFGSVDILAFRLFNS